MEESKFKMAICTLSGTVCGLAAYLMAKKLTAGMGAKFRERKHRNIATLKWEGMQQSDLKRELILAIMDHPGLLFGWRDPTLRDTFRSEAPDYTKEYMICL